MGWTVLLPIHLMIVSLTGIVNGNCNDDKVSICYYSNWAYYRSGTYKYTVQDIDLSTCTHLVYAFAVLDSNTYKIKAFDPYLDLEDNYGLGNYKQFTALKQQKPGLKTLLAIGGWTDSTQSSKYSDLVANFALRQQFINHAKAFIVKYGFDGLDLDWEYPGRSPYGRPQDKANFATFVQELKSVFEPEGLLVTAAVGAPSSTANAGYDVPLLSQYLDYVHLMTYDFHGSWDNIADHHSPLFERSTVNDGLNSDDTVKYWLSRGCPASKLVLGVPLYGRTFTLATSSHSPPAPSSGPGNAGFILRDKGFLSYLEICSTLNNGQYVTVQDPLYLIGPYAYNGNDWIGYDDVSMVRKKANYVKNNGLAGIMVWAVDLEDFTGSCGLGRNPLMSAIRDELDICNPTIPINPLTTATSLTTATASVSQTSQLECTGTFTCPGDGLWADPCDCKNYYNCFFGSYTKFTCPALTLFHQDNQVCDWEDNVDCSLYTNKPSSSATTPPKTIITTTAAVLSSTTTIVPHIFTADTQITSEQPPVSCAFSCPGNGLFSDPCSCNNYYNCWAGIAYKFTCSEGTLWNQEVTTCDWEHNVLCDLGAVEPTTQPATTDSNCPPFVCPSNGFWPDPCDCAKYYICYRHFSHHCSCDTPSFLWNSEQEFCDRSENVTC